LLIYLLTLDKLVKKKH